MKLLQKDQTQSCIETENSASETVHTHVTSWSSIFTGSTVTCKLCIPPLFLTYTTILTWRGFTSIHTHGRYI